MNDEEISNWLICKLKSCQQIILKNDINAIYFIEDQKSERKMKMCKLNNQKFTPNTKIKSKGNCLFELKFDVYNLYYSFNCDYIVCSKIKNKYNLTNHDFNNTKERIKNVINKNKIFKHIDFIFFCDFNQKYFIENINNVKIITGTTEDALL